MSTMRSSVERSAILGLAGLLLCSTVHAAKYQAPPSIIPTLPKYCWAQYVDGLENNPAYQINGCGAYSNHFCPGLVQIAQARTARERWKRKELLEQAKINMEYTLNWTNDIPTCFLRPQAQGQLRIIDLKLRLLK